MTCAGPLDFGTIAKHPDERIVIEFDFIDNLADYWEPGRQYEAGNTRRPSLENGFIHRAANGGSSAHREPRWAKIAGGLTLDGSVTWESLVATQSDAIDPIVAATASCDGDLQIPSDPTIESALAKVTTQGGTHGTDYSLECKVTTQSGVILVGVIRVQVREKIEC